LEFNQITEIYSLLFFEKYMHQLKKWQKEHIWVGILLASLVNI